MPTFLHLSLISVFFGLACGCAVGLLAGAAMRRVNARRSLWADQIGVASQRADLTPPDIWASPGVELMNFESDPLRFSADRDLALSTFRRVRRFRRKAAGRWSS
jgi:hypothetical protein